MTEDSRLSRVREAIRAYPDFPKKGILFRDIMPLLRDPAVYGDLIWLLENRYSKLTGIDVIVGLESRGFLIGPTLAYCLQKPFVPIRKAGKLPGATKRAEYLLEYGKDVFEIQAESIQAGKNVLLVDDLLATGGTMAAAIKLIESADAKVLECAVIVELLDLKGREKINSPIFTLVAY